MMRLHKVCAEEAAQLKRILPELEEISCSDHLRIKI